MKEMPTIISYTTHENSTIPFQRYVIYCMQKKPTQEIFLADIAFAKDVLLLESEAIKNLIGRLDHNFQKAIDLIFNCKGRVVVTGIGKAGIIGQKISATLASTGTPSYWIHSSEARHGDLGRIVAEDVVLALLQR